MSAFLSVRALHEEGVPKKTIARRLGLDVRTVRKYIRRIEAGATEPGRRRVPSKLDPYAERIEDKVQQGLSAVQIHQDLVREIEGFEASYETVKRRVRTLRREEPQVYCRMRYGAGEEAQIDFGEVGRLPVDGRRRKVYLFVMTLCFSRQAYYELVIDQTVPELPPIPWTPEQLVFKPRFGAASRTRREKGTRGRSACGAGYTTPPGTRRSPAERG